MSSIGVGLANALVAVLWLLGGHYAVAAIWAAIAILWSLRAYLARSKGDA